MQELVYKMVEQEKIDMFGFQSPETDMDDHYYTTVGITLFQMMDQNVGLGEGVEVEGGGEGRGVDEG